VIKALALLSVRINQSAAGKIKENPLDMMEVKKNSDWHAPFYSFGIF
jgi:hypothetical protein